MKIPEGPHTFLTTRALASKIGPSFEIVEHRTFLACPGGPPALSAAVDRLPGLAALGWGFFQYVVAPAGGSGVERKRAPWGAPYFHVRTAENPLFGGEGFSAGF